MQDHDGEISIRPVAFFRSPFTSRFGIPRQSGIVDELEGQIVFTPEFRREEAIRAIEGYDYLWLIWGFSGNAGKWGMTVRPPRLGGNRSVGVFASRSPFRPNGLGLSSARLLDVGLDCKEAPVLTVSGADLMDGTPIYDIKPYIRYTDSHENARSGFTDEKEWREAEVVFPADLEKKFLEMRHGCSDGATDMKALVKTLAQRPVPQYRHDPDRIFGMPFMGCDIKFRVSEDTVTVTGIDTAMDTGRRRGRRSPENEETMTPKQ